MRDNEIRDLRYLEKVNRDFDFFFQVDVQKVVAVVVAVMMREANK